MYEGATYVLDIATKVKGFVPLKQSDLTYTIGTTKLGNLKMNLLDDQLKKMRVGETKTFEFKVELDNTYANYWKIGSD